MDETLTDKISAATLADLIEAVEAWRERHPDWDALKVHYYSLFDLSNQADGWSARIDARRRVERDSVLSSA